MAERQVSVRVILPPPQEELQAENCEYFQK
jgi:hypothetical protein